MSNQNTAHQALASLAEKHSLRDIAKATDLSASQLSRWLSGKRRIPAEHWSTLTDPELASRLSEPEAVPDDVTEGFQKLLRWRGRHGMHIHLGAQAHEPGDWADGTPIPKKYWNVIVTHVAFTDELKAKLRAMAREIYPNIDNEP